MLIRDRVLFSLLIAVMLVTPVRSFGDQRDARLGPLFDRLRAASSPSEAFLYEYLIREIWLEFENPLIHQPLKRAVSAMERQNLRLASSQFDQVVENAPDFAEGWHKRATVHFLMGNFEAAMADIERTLALEPRHFAALVKLGLICVQLDEPAAALRSFEAALELHPHHRYLEHRVNRLRHRLAGHRI